MTGRYYILIINNTYVEMGQIQNKQSKNINYRLISAFQDYSLVTIDNTLLCLRQYNFVSEKQWNNSLHRFQNSKKVTSTQQHISHILHIQIHKQQTLCSSFYRIMVFFQHSPHTLFSQIQSRKKERRMFQEKQLWSILCSCVLALAYLHQHSFSYGSLSLYDITLTTQGVIKLNHPYNVTNYQKQLFRPDYFYAPQELIDKTHDIHKADIFNLGLILIRCANIQKDFCFYEKQTLSHTTLNHYLKQTSKKYSESLSAIIESMVKINAEERPNWIDLQNFILKVISKQSSISIKQRYKPKFVNNKDSFNQQKKINNKPLIRSQQLLAMSIEIADQKNIQSNQPLIDNQILDENAEKISIINQNQINQFYNKNHSEAELTTQSYHQQNQQQIIILKNSQKHNLNISKPNQQLTFVTEQYQRGRYQGNKADKYRHGFGTFYYNQGGVYSGNWCLNKMHGIGTLYYPSGKIAYQGEWSNDKLHGKGVLYNQNVQKLISQFNYNNLNQIQDYWVKYEGEFSQDNKNGMGKLWLSNNEFFEGYFQNDQANGEGKFYRDNILIVKGIWQNNIRIEV